MKVEVAFVFIANHNEYFAYENGACVGQIRKNFGGWMFRPARSAENIFSPTQLTEIHQACHARAALLNLTARMLR